MRNLTRKSWVSTGAAVVVVAAHLLVVTPLDLGTAMRKRPVMPDMPGAGASALTSSAQLADAMTLVDLSHTVPSMEPPLEDMASSGIELPQVALIIASPDPTPAPVLDEDAIEDRDITEAAGDKQGHALMFGRYLGQVSARIERAWTRPRSAIGAPRFGCQTKIEQDEQGKVLSIELRHCNGDARWQGSLVAAIEHASPLPAPPAPSVFARMLVLDFSAESYQAGFSNAHDYEPEIRLAAANESMAPVQSVTNADKTLADIPQHQGAIDLRIEGKTITWTLHEAQPDSVQQNTAVDELKTGDESPDVAPRDER